MLAFREFVYLDLQKTGCTFLRERLLDICAGEPLATAKHAPLARLPGCPRLMTIRRPLPYFVSLWKYGLDGRGGFHAGFRDTHPQAWADRTPRSFRAFLDLALTAGRFVAAPRALATDVYTARILELLVPRSDRADFLDQLDAAPPLATLPPLLQPYLPEVLLRTESLNADFHAHVAGGRLAFLPLREGWQAAFPPDAERRNTSSGDTGMGVDELYDAASRERVLQACGLATALHARAGAAPGATADA